MIKTFIDRLLGKSPAKAGKAGVAKVPLGKRVEVPAAEHRINPELLDERAVRVVRTLKDAGFEAYIVGGAVRDLLVNRRPKDFDVATNATPEEVKALFRRAFIIGRRFRIVHVIFGRGREHEVVEVSTFRAYLDNSAAEQVGGNEKTSKAELANKSHAVDAAGRVLRDNVWGPQIEDAARRDFTINAMYYDPVSEIVVDYHGGLKDIERQVLRMIGDPVTRYREDPVRIVRVVRFAAKLGFQIEAKTRAPIAEMAALLDNIPVSRLFDETIKLLQTGHAVASVQELRKQGLGSRFPMLDVLIGPGADQPQHAERRKFVELALADTDRRVAENRPVAPSFLLACLLWHEVLAGWQRRRDAGDPPFPALMEAVDAVFDARVGDISGRGKLGTDMREIWGMQPRFERRTGNAPFSLVEQPRFRAGYDFLRLRADAGEVDPALAEWWEDFALGTPEEREALLAAAREQQGKTRRVPAAGGAAAKPPRSRKPKAEAGEAAVAAAGDNGGDDAEGADASAELDGDEGLGSAPSDGAPARKRRRRRRKPAGAASAGAEGSESGPAAAPGGEAP
ncbi:polynucleotide adenylyltransferase PcnB [Aquincola tertiaricarbonis]|uniref:Poly(A) polymerase I n=1 Tax=Aquincola tertiaricarbonis TaxID=391953 RepID=A0ABY4SK50_AQUTE|nr:polynucleotide adenylyltransferase PcnB [Aquincola tertiaricarbonis]URI11376.1 polynucleotide adenylyltransferase PcnB [Aquincola tertiaricarbonis]